MNQGVHHVKQDSFEYTFNLAMELVKPHIEKRDKKVLVSTTKQKIRLALGCNGGVQIDCAADGPTIGETRKRCTSCLKDTVGKNYSQSCCDATFQTHLVQKCMSCIEK